MTKTMEVEFTDEQFEKVKAMESKGISVGEAIDMLFRIFNCFWTELDNIKKLQDVFKEFFFIAVSKFKVIVEFFMSFSVQAFFNVEFA